jgi:hypothetical protein
VVFAVLVWSLQFSFGLGIEEFLDRHTHLSLISLFVGFDLGGSPVWHPSAETVLAGLRTHY